MTDRELMQQVLDALDSDNPDIQLRTAVALRDRLAQPEPLFSTPDVTPHVIDCPRCGHCCPQPNQEPVAWMYVNLDGECEQIEYEAPPDDPSVTPLYIIPPHRQWVGLTDEEIKSLPSWWPSYEDAPALIELVKDVEAKLREKNGG